MRTGTSTSGPITAANATKHCISDVIEWTRENEIYHPNQKPVHVIIPQIVTYARVGGVIQDRFMGGTTLVAAMHGDRGIYLNLNSREGRWIHLAFGPP